MESKYNLKSPAVKRLMKEAAELRDPTEHYHAQPLEDNLFEWHFSVRGPPDSDFDGGIYHGRILLPPEYPMKPPSIILLTPNGRFEVGKKICLSISGHHPETWQPSWSIRTALIAIIGFMPTKGEGAIGSLDYTPEERRVLAKKSQDFCCETCNCSLSSTLLPLNPNSDISLEDQMANELAHQINFKTESNLSSKMASEGEDAGAEVSDLTPEQSVSNSSSREAVESSLTEQTETSTATGADRERSSNDDRPHSPTRRRAILHQRDNNQAPNRPRLIAEVHQPQNDGHTGSAVLIVVLTLALAALIFRRIFLAHDYKFEYEL
ncbi:ubiquitin-conjugating enzyme E2 J1 isoform X1 [Corythoichthys intestinalis]|uniref:ubiquitin-conjugating enzyme E2 J1 isoform X1 n=2 Tax=Corythoichthys intestinalis TaxID=161448 RepID=UPI0025A54A62|nr:ubiquitin-conjugating enzyme E2 J1 isoform X1 [Corythoichthys intestinalis]XP_057679213.1 ubiquitin-conjugating enzyme E2 J1 isoform X1 [Corythoichthys intestinalis]